MRAGSLRDRVEVLRRIEWQTSSGEIRFDWRVAFSLWGDVSVTSARELIASGREISEVKWRVFIRGGKDISPTMRVRARDKVLEIKAVIPDGRSGKEYMTLLCEEIK